MPPVRCANAASSARLFVQLCARPAVSAPSAISLLDVLLPPRTRAFHLAAAKSTRFALRAPGTTTNSSRSQVRQQASPRRHFSVTSAWQKTKAIYNPQQDEDGNEMMLEITPRAANRLSQVMAKDENPHLALRIQVESGGCHGFQYLISLTTLPPTLTSSSSSTPHPPSPSTAAQEAPSTTTSATPSTPTPALNEDDTVFAFLPDSNSHEEGTLAAAPPKIVLDGPSLELLKGSKVDFTMELIGSQFKITDNPHATSSCGCGTSFDIKA
ncbi:hypothetical protein F5Y15DRAFT_417613 [Xylariaceae sp. FL0016]|nr:hypothetical protein F5Y15DRAFT_417613 [Xylariaceae sp. FL0016]